MKKKAPVYDDRLDKLHEIVDRAGPITHFIGIDESGTGAWAGPFYISAVYGPRRWSAEGLRDSKKTDKAHRERMFTEIEGDAHVFHGEGAAWPEDITKRSHAGAYVDALAAAVKAVMKHCTTPMRNLAFIIDGSSNQKVRDILRPYGCSNILFQTKADEFVPHVSAASIIAKFNRDVEMNLLDNKFPGYNFNTNAGYGTPEHIEALVHLGPVPHVHRTER